MRIGNVTFVLTALVVLNVVRAAASVSVVDEADGSVVVEIRFDGRHAPTTMLDEPGMPVIGYERFFVAVSDAARVRVTQLEPVFTDRRGELPPLATGEGRSAGVARPETGLLPRQPFVVSKPMTVRRTTVVAIDCFAAQVDYSAARLRNWSRYRIRVDYPPASVGESAARVDPFVDQLVVNKRFLPTPDEPRAATTLSSAAMPYPRFALSTNWVKVWVSRPGVYAISGSDLAGIGVSPASIIDPGSFRLFTGSGQQLNRDLTVPGGTFLPANWMSECDIVVEYGGDGSFDPGDRVIFYGVGTPGWTDLYEPGASRDAHTDHTHVERNVYYLTWDDTPGFAGSPGRMAQVDAAPSAAPDLTTFEERRYFEVDRQKAFTFGGDGWMWLEATEQTGAQSFPLKSFGVVDLDSSVPQTFRTVAVSRDGSNNANHHARYRMNGQVIGEKIWNGVPPTRFEDGEPVELTGFFLAEGDNVLTLEVPRDLNPSDFMYFAWYSVFYQRRLRALNDALSFSSPDTTETVNVAVDNFATAGAMYVFDVTDRLHPVRLTGALEETQGSERRIRFSSSGTGEPRYYWAGTSGALASSRPEAMTRHSPRDLRNVTAPPNMVIVTHPSFVGSAQRLQRHRETLLPFFSDPVVEAVTTTDIYDNFSGGLADPMAIRNYCKFLYDNYADAGGNPDLAYLLLLGDASVDIKGIASSQPDLVTSYLNLDPFDLETYVTDDVFAYLDSTDTPGAGLIDLAVGRLPAGTLLEASFIVDRVIDYELNADFDAWRDRAILVADDEISTLTSVQPEFIFYSEGMAHSSSLMAPYIEPFKIYLTEFETIQGIKPGSRIKFIDTWNDGAVLINYVGHGSSVQMADEQVFLQSDVAHLRNGLRLPFFIGMSCTIGDFGEEAKSLSERLLFKEDGGVVATLTASELTFLSRNSRLGQKLTPRLFPQDPGVPTPLGAAVMGAKNEMISGRLPLGSLGEQENNEKYNLLGDPALRLHSPRRSIRLETVDIDTLVAGKRETVRGTVLVNGVPDTGFSGIVTLVVREPDDDDGYTRESDGYFIPYRYPRGTMFIGTADVVAGAFEFSFRVPRSTPAGDKAFVLAYAQNGVLNAAARSDSTVFRTPTAADSTALQPVDAEPRIALGFKGFQGGEQITVKPGAVLVADIVDGDGVNILNTTPEGRLALVFDKAALALDVTRFFEFDHGGVDTSGTLEFPLPDLGVGSHRAVLKASDTFGQTSSDTLVFKVTDPLDYSANVVLNYPNPFATTTYFLVTLTDPADIEVDIFTVSGKRIRSLSALKEAGEQWIEWDGRDATGSTIANGTYLYVARVGFVGLDRAPLVIRGKVVKIE